MDVGSAEEDGPEPGPMAGCGCDLMLLKEPRGISIISFGGVAIINHLDS